jgi:hypothetical protein
VIVYPKFLNRLGIVLETGNIGLYAEGNRDLAYKKTLEQRATWQEHVCPILVPEDSARRSSWPTLGQHCTEWMEGAKRIAVAGYRQVLEDGPDMCDSEREAEHTIMVNSGTILTCTLRIR